MTQSLATMIGMQHAAEGKLTDQGAPLWGVMAEFEDVDTLLAACAKVRDAGFTKWDAHTPFPIHGIDEVMGLKPSVLPWLVLIGGVTGCSLGTLLVWYTNAAPTLTDLPYYFQSYHFLISGKPIFSFAANIPVLFEMTILLSAFTAVFGMLLLNRLPWLYHPLFNRPKFRRVTNDRFFIVIDADDPKFAGKDTESFLASIGASSVEQVEA